MKQFVKILTYLFLLVLLTAEDCGNSTPEPSPSEIRVSLYQTMEDEFTTDQLSEVQLAAFEKRAEQKLIDLFELINMYSDTSLNVQFRQQARQTIANAFISETDFEEFLGSLINTSKESVNLSRSLQLDFATQYSGGISFIYTQGEETLTGEMKVVLKKVSKQFGNSELEVWDVYFSEF
ncbi:MAG: hypothetical protein R3182_02645 [Draconibacterium sp.]|nr:hypothetical protein [Draconibacterium sp.]